MSKSYGLRKYGDFSNPVVHKTLMETSKDDSKNPCEYISHNKQRVIDFDEVKKYYLKDRDICEGNAKSVDALYLLEDGTICLTEFKNGDFKSSEIIEKALSSVLMFCDITKNDLTYMRENATFVLVYNSDAMKVETRQQMAQKKAHRAKEKYFLFGLDNLDSFCFNKVVEIEKEEFDDTVYSKSIIPY